MHNEEWGVLQLGFTLYTKNWTGFCNYTHPNTARCSLGWFCRACAAPNNTVERHKDVPCLIHTPHYSWFTSRLSYQLQAMLINSHASNCRVLGDFNFMKLPIFKEHFQWAWLKWQRLYWQIQSERKKKKKSLISNHSQLIYHTQAAKYGCAKSVSFQMLLAAYSKPLQRIFPWVTSHAATHTSPHPAYASKQGCRVTEQH